MRGGDKRWSGNLITSKPGISKGRISTRSCFQQRKRWDPHLKMSSDFHTCVVTYMHSHSYTRMHLHELTQYTCIYTQRDT